MERIMNGWDALIAESKALERLAQRVQGKGATAEADDELRDRYAEWLADCLAALPSDLREEFRSYYRGDGNAPRIQDFLSNPRAVEVGQGYAVGEGRRYVPNQFGSFDVVNTPGMSYTPRWLRHTYENHFYPNLLAQRNLLVEASRRAVAPSITSDAVALICQ
jgi:hypothetical protein